jgi:hypothetical protein
MTPSSSSATPPAACYGAINNLALQSLVAGFSPKKSIVDQSAAKMAVVEVVGD